MLILECSQGCYGRTDGSVTISLRNFVGEGIIKTEKFTGPNKVLLILGRRTGIDREGCLKSAV